MPVWIVLLRGVNLGKRRMPMEALREVCGGLDCQPVRTYVQSGNVVLSSPEARPEILAARLRSAIEARFGFSCDLVVRTPSALRSAMRANPFAGRAGLEPGKLVVLFCESRPSAALVKKLHALPSHPDEIQVRGAEVFVYYPNGQGKATLPFTAFDRVLRMPATGRNWNTVEAIAAMAAEMESGATAAGDAAPPRERKRK